MRCSERGREREKMAGGRYMHVQSAGGRQKCLPVGSTGNVYTDEGEVGGQVAAGRGMQKKNEDRERKCRGKARKQNANNVNKKQRLQRNENVCMMERRWKM